MMDECKHHPKYDPASGKPDFTLHLKSHNRFGDDQWIKSPCPYCWQARVKWLDAKLAVNEDLFDTQIKNSKHLAKKLLERIKELEPDGERLDLVIKHMLILHPPVPTADEFDEMWVICDYTLPNYVDCLSKDKDLRQAIDKARKEQA